MKKFYFVAMILAIGVLLNACQKDETLPIEIDFKKGKVKTETPGGDAVAIAPLENLLEYPEHYAEVCIDPENPIYFAMTDQITVQWGGQNGENNTKIVDLRVFNTETHFVFEFISTHSPQNLYIDYVEILSVNSPNVWRTHMVELSENWQAGDLLEFFVRIEGQGAPAEFNVEYKLIGICEDACEESFTYVANEDGTYTFTYIPAEDMTGAEVVFTFGQGVVVSGLEGFTAHGSTMQNTMDLTACEVYEWTVTLTPDCSGNSGNSNVWTDFKVNSESKKGVLPNIVIACN